jgi:hypothetical protein
MKMKDYSNYHNTNPNDRIMHDGTLMLEHSLNGFEGYDVLINDTVETRLMIYGKYGADSDTKSIIGYPADIERGNVVKVDEENWLVISYPVDNKVYRKAEMRVCNATFPIISDKTKVLKGHDDFGRPIYEYVSNTNHTPCIVESRYSFTRSDQQITLPDNRIEIMIKYVESESLQLDAEFEMRDGTYKIKNIDYSQVINDKGILVISAERQVG